MARPVADAASFPADRTIAAAMLAEYAAEDLRVYEGQLAALFPQSMSSYPADSIAQLIVDRATAWLQRLSTTNGAMAGRARMAAAIIAWRAAQDSLARRLFETRLTELGNAPAERSLVLATAIALLTDPRQDDARRSRNLPMAKQYATQLVRLPLNGYATRVDSTNVAQRQHVAAVNVLGGAGALSSEAAAKIGTLAPAVRAHAWLNTADSMYSPTPRVHPLNDGILRVLAFGHRTPSELPLFDWLQRQFPSGVQVLFVTETEGYGGPDLLDPASEVAWLKTFYADRWHVTLPIAIWAGEKVVRSLPVASPRAGVITQRVLPTPSPVLRAYDFATHGTNCVVVDGQGMIRAYGDIHTRRQAVAFMRLLTTFRADSVGR